MNVNLNCLVFFIAAPSIKQRILRKRHWWSLWDKSRWNGIFRNENLKDLLRFFKFIRLDGLFKFLKMVLKKCSVGDRLI